MIDEYDAQQNVREKANLGVVNFSPLDLPQLRAYWKFSSINQSGNAFDIGGQVKTLTANNTPTFGVDHFAAYAILDGVDQSFSRADEAGLDITGAMCMGGWYYFDDTASAVEVCISKWLTGGDQRSYTLQRNASGNPVFAVSSDGTLANVKAVTGTDVLAASKWTYLVGRYTPSSELAVFSAQDNGNNGICNKAINTTAIPAAVKSGTAALIVGSIADPDFYLDGRVAEVFLSADDQADGLINAIYSKTRKKFKV